MLPELPPEVWECVFEHATYVHGMPDPNTDSYTGLIDILYSKEFRARIHDALYIKQAIARVCKQWWYLAIPILYRSVYIGRARAVFTLSNTLARSATKGNALAGARPFGEYIRQLYVIMLRFTQNPDFGVSQLPALIGRMPHLTIFSFTISPGYSIRTGMASSVLDALRLSASSLRALDWPSVHEPSASGLLDFLRQCPQLRLLNCPGLVWSEEHECVVLPPTVTTLHLRTFVHPEDLETPPIDAIAQQPPQLSALRELVVHPECSIYRWQNVLRACGSQLTSIQFSSPDYRSKAHMRILAEEMPRLERLSIACTSFPSVLESDPEWLFPSVMYLGVRYCLSHPPKHDFEKLVAFLGELASRAPPALRAVQLLNEEHVECLLRTHTMLAVQALRPFADGAVFRVEDHEGMLLTDRLKRLGHM